MGQTSIRSVDLGAYLKVPLTVRVETEKRKVIVITWIVSNRILGHRPRYGSQCLHGCQVAAERRCDVPTYRPRAAPSHSSTRSITNHLNAAFTLIRYEYESEYGSTTVAS